jgi:hypothetical protein
MFLQWSFAPGGELLLQISVEPTDGDFKPLPSAIGRLLRRMSRAHPGHEYLRKSILPPAVRLGGSA